MQNETRPHRADPAPRQPRHGLARARPDSPALRPLHSATRTRFAGDADVSLHSDGHKQPRQAGTYVRCPGGNSVRAASFRFAVASRKQSALTPNYRQWADTSFIRLRAVLRCATLFPLPHFARRSAGWPRSQRKPRSRWRDSPNEPRPRKFNIGTADGWHEGF